MCHVRWYCRSTRKIKKKAKAGSGSARRQAHKDEPRRSGRSPKNHNLNLVEFGLGIMFVIISIFEWRQFNEVFHDMLLLS